ITATAVIAHWLRVESKSREIVVKCRAPAVSVPAGGGHERAHSAVACAFKVYPCPCHSKQHRSAVACSSVYQLQKARQHDTLFFIWQREKVGRPDFKRICVLFLHALLCLRRAAALHWSVLSSGIQILTRLILPAPDLS